MAGLGVGHVGYIMPSSDEVIVVFDEAWFGRGGGVEKADKCL